MSVSLHAAEALLVGTLGFLMRMQKTALHHGPRLSPEQQQTLRHFSLRNDSTLLIEGTSIQVVNGLGATNGSHRQGGEKEP